MLRMHSHQPLLLHWPCLPRGCNLGLLVLLSELLVLLKHLQHLGLQLQLRRDVPLWINLRQAQVSSWYGPRLRIALCGLLH